MEAAGNNASASVRSKVGWTMYQQLYAVVMCFVYSICIKYTSLNGHAELPRYARAPGCFYQKTNSIECMQYLDEEVYLPVDRSGKNGQEFRHGYFSKLQSIRYNESLSKNN